MSDDKEYDEMTTIKHTITDDMDRWLKVECKTVVVSGPIWLVTQVKAAHSNHDTAATLLQLGELLTDVVLRLLISHMCNLSHTYCAGIFDIHFYFLF